MVSKRSTPCLVSTVAPMVPCSAHRAACCDENCRRDGASIAVTVLPRGFYGHRLHLYRGTVPHTGFTLLLGLMQSKPAGGFVVTSNVDGQVCPSRQQRTCVLCSVHH